MGVTLRHAIKINASPGLVFQALTDTTEMQHWHHGAAAGQVAIGEVLQLDSKPGLTFSWETKEIVPNEKVVQVCVEGPGSSVGKTLSVVLTDVGNGATLVELSDGEWADDDASLPFCSTHWGGVLHRLKSHLEA